MTEDLPTSDGAVTLAALRLRAFDAYAGWVRAGIGVAVLAYASIVVLGVWVGRPRMDLGLESMALAVAGLALVLSFRGRLRAATVTALAGVWLEIHLDLLLQGNLRGSSIFVTPTLVVAAGLFMGPKPAWAVALTSVVSGPAAVYAGGALGLSAGLQLPGDVSFWIPAVATFLATAALVQMSLSTFGDVLRESDRSRRRYEGLVRQAPDGILTLDDRLRVLEANPAAADLLERAPEALIGRSFEEALDAGAPGVARALETLPESGGSLTLPLGGMGPSRRVLEVSARAVQAGSRAAGPAYQVMLRDISDRVAMEERSAQMGRILSEADTEILVVEAESGRLAQVSRGARRNLGYEHGELEGLPVERICPGLGLEGLPALLQRTGGGAPVRERGVHRRADGTVYPVETEYLRASLAGVPVLVAFAVDVSDRERAEEEQRALQLRLEHAQRMEAVGQLAGGVAHDFNNLLTVIGGCTEVLQDQAPPELWDLIAEIAGAQEQGAVLTRQLLAFARRDVVQPRVLSVSDLLHGLQPLLARLAGSSVRLDLEVADEGSIVADPGQIEQVVMNLVANARDAMPGGGRIGVRAARAHHPRVAGGDCWCIEVTDQGAGIPADVRSHIFEPFFTTKSRGKGTGLGLATVHGIVTQADGAVEVTSEPGAGTTFRVFWPLSDAEPDEEEAGDAAVPPRASGFRILLAEDDAGARRMVKRMLELDGHTVTAVDSGEAAQEALERPGAGFDLLLTDVVMGGISGIELAGRVRAAGLQIPVLLVSGYLDEKLHGAVPGDPCTRLLHKPFRRAELTHHVQDLVLAAAGGAAAP